ncbi:hypothetical protein [Streptomyces sp. NBC_00211]|uniref:hypothetical protein n=1 Tax=Streptomyces sp. NBC_00211 TaxID=2975683 RepID=UPI003247740C
MSLLAQGVSETDQGGQFELLVRNGLCPPRQGTQDVSGFGLRFGGPFLVDQHPRAVQAGGQQEVVVDVVRLLGLCDQCLELGQK